MTTDTLTAQLQEEARGRMTANILWRDTEARVLERHLDDVIKDVVATAVQRAREEILAQTKFRKRKLQIGANEYVCKKLNVSLNDIHLHNATASGFDDGYKQAMLDVQKYITQTNH